MADALDSFVDQVQNDIFDQTQKEFGPGFSRRWRNPTFMGHMQNPSTEATLTGSCGDQMQIFLKIEQDTVQRAAFQCTGCGPSIVSGDAACELAQGKSLEEAAAMEGEDIVAVLGRLPEDKEHCAHLASRTVREAIRLHWMDRST